MFQLNPLPADSLRGLEEVAYPTKGYPFPESGSRTLLSTPLFTVSGRAWPLVRKALQRDGVGDTHKNIVKYCLTLELDIYKDERGNYYAA